MPRAVYRAIYDAIGNPDFFLRAPDPVRLGQTAGVGSHAPPPGQYLQVLVGFGASGRRSPSCDDDPRFHWWITPPSCPPPAYSLLPLLHSSRFFLLQVTEGSPAGRVRVSESAVCCCGCAEWSPAMSTSGGDVELRVQAGRR